MGDVAYLPVSDHMTADQALDSAKQLGLTDVLIVGYDKDGCVTFRSSHMLRKDAFWMAEKMKQFALGD